jgi:surface carbohydrate biosynthesis protein (TIGR04326 family)
MASRAGETRLVAFYTRYPVLWEHLGDRARERNFGTFPDYLAEQGFGVVYPAVLSANWAGTRPNVDAFRSEARRLGVVFLEPLLSLWEFLRVYLDVSHAFGYLRWRWRRAGEPVCFDGLDVRELVLRELDPGFLYGSELLTNHARAYAFRRFCRTYRPRVIFHPFEYQPMERALWAGVRAGESGTTIVGTQSGMFSSNWLGWVYAPGEAATPGAVPGRYQSALPDYVVAYGTLSHAALSHQCHSDRVLLPGAIRYPEIQAQWSDGSSLPDLPDGTRILVACSASREETVLLLRAAADLARAKPETFLLLKFHFHNPMHADWESLAKTFGLTRFRICDTDLATLLKESRAVVLGSSSVVVEAIALGCMPVVFQPPDRYSYSPALDIREAVFLCSDLSTVARALKECIEQTDGYWDRRRAWPQALERMAFRLEGRQDERLRAQLRERGVL